MLGDFNFTVHKNKSEPLVNNLYKLHQHTFASDSVQNSIWNLFGLELLSKRLLTSLHYFQYLATEQYHYQCHGGPHVLLVKERSMSQ